MSKRDCVVIDRILCDLSFPEKSQFVVCELGTLVSAIPSIDTHRSALRTFYGDPKRAEDTAVILSYLERGPLLKVKIFFIPAGTDRETVEEMFRKAYASIGARYEPACSYADIPEVSEEAFLLKALRAKRVTKVICEEIRKPAEEECL